MPMSTRNGQHNHDGVCFILNRFLKFPCYKLVAHKMENWILDWMGFDVSCLVSGVGARGIVQHLQMKWIG